MSAATADPVNAATMARASPSFFICHPFISGRTQSRCKRKYLRLQRDWVRPLIKGWQMKKLGLALAIVAAFTGSAVAADMAPRAYSKAPALMMAPSWTGLWVSGGFGFGMMEYNTSVTSVAGTTVFDSGHDTGGKGWLGKVGLGYDHQFIGNFVIGAFADAQWSDIKGQNSFTCPGICSGPTQGYSGQIKNDWSWSVGGRVGYVALPGLLTYFNGGFTQANFERANYVVA